MWKIQLRQTPFMVSVPTIHPTGHGPLTLQVTFLECTELARVSAFCWNHADDNKLTQACSANDRVEILQLVPPLLCPTSPFASHLPCAQGHLSDTRPVCRLSRHPTGKIHFNSFSCRHCWYFQGILLAQTRGVSSEPGRGTRALRRTISSLKPSYSLLDFF